MPEEPDLTGLSTLGAAAPPQELVVVESPNPVEDVNKGRVSPAQVEANEAQRRSRYVP